MLDFNIDEFIRNLDLLDEFITSNILGIDDFFANQKLINNQIPEKETPSIMSAYNSMRGYRKKFNYSAIIILTYGYFEDFLERAAKQYVKTIASLVKGFEQLPDRIKQNHFSKSVELSQRLKLDKYKDTTSQEEIVANLFSCQNSNSNGFILNLEAYAMHTANFRYEIIDAVFADTGVEQINKSIINEPNFAKYLRNSLEIGDKEEIEESFLAKATKLKLQETLNDLAQRRNEIAHGTDIDDVLSPKTILSRYIVFLNQYAQSLGYVLQNSVVSFQNSLLGEEIGSCFKLGHPVKVWTDGNEDNTIPGFENISSNEEIMIRIGSELIIERLNRQSKEHWKAKVLTIEINRIPRESITLSLLPQSFTLGLDQKVKKNHVVFVRKLEQ